MAYYPADNYTINPSAFLLFDFLKSKRGGKCNLTNKEKKSLKLISGQIDHSIEYGGEGS